MTKPITRSLGWVTAFTAVGLVLIGVDYAHALALAIVVGVVVAATRLDERAHHPAYRPEPPETPAPSLITRSRLPSTAGRAAVGVVVGENAGRIVLNALHDHPGDPLLHRLADTYGADWRVLPRDELIGLLDHLDELDRRGPLHERDVTAVHRTPEDAALRARPAPPARAVPSKEHHG